MIDYFRALFLNDDFSGVDKQRPYDTFTPKIVVSSI